MYEHCQDSAVPPPNALHHWMYIGARDYDLCCFQLGRCFILLGHIFVGCRPDDGTAEPTARHLWTHFVRIQRLCLDASVERLVRHAKSGR